jgi:hypothetical protein
LKAAVMLFLEIKKEYKNGRGRGREQKNNNLG